MTFLRSHAPGRVPDVETDHEPRPACGRSTLDQNPSDSAVGVVQSRHEPAVDEVLIERDHFLMRHLSRLVAIIEILEASHAAW